MSPKPRLWTETEDELLLRFYFTHTRKEIAHLLGRTLASIRKRCSRLGLNQKHPAVEEFELNAIRQWYMDHQDVALDNFDLDELAQKLNRTKSYISRLAGRMGLTRQGRPVSAELSADIGARAKQRVQAQGHPRGMLGKTHTNEFKKEQSERSKKTWENKTPLDRELMAVKRNRTMLERYGTGNPSMKGTNGYSRTRKGKRADLDNQYFRSSWEANYARYLNWLKRQGKIKDWQYEPQTFVFHGVTRGVLTYTPDFKVIEMDDSYVWHEVKGWMDAKSKAKLKRMAKFYPNEPLVVIGKAEYKDIAKWAALLPGWEE